MLNGLDPIIIFNFKKLPPAIAPTIAKIPVVSQIVNAIDLPVIPIYLKESLTGLFIDSEAKSIEIDTQIDTASDGSTPATQQRGLSSTVKIEMKANKNSIGVALFAAMADLIFPKVTSKEYSITYLNGAVTVYAGLLHSFSISQNADTDLYEISMELMHPSGESKPGTPVVQKVTGTVPL